MKQKNIKDKWTLRERLNEIARICERAARVAPTMKTRWNYALKESDCDRIWDLSILRTPKRKAAKI